MAKLNPKGRQIKAVAYCNPKYHVGDLTLDMLYENQCIEKNCLRLVILSEKLKKRVDRYKNGEICRHDLYGHK